MSGFSNPFAGEGGFINPVAGGNGFVPISNRRRYSLTDEEEAAVNEAIQGRQAKPPVESPEITADQYRARFGRDQYPEDFMRNLESVGIDWYSMPEWKRNEFLHRQTDLDWAEREFEDQRRRAGLRRALTDQTKDR